NYSATGVDGDVLFTALAPIAHRVGVGIGAQLRFPQLLAGIGVEGAEATVVRGPHEHQPPRGRGRAGAAGVADQALALGKFVDHAERNRPLDGAAVCVDGHQLAPRRLIARRLRPLGAAVLVILAGDRRAEREERSLSIDAGAIVGLVGVVGVEAVAFVRFLALDPADQRGVLRVDEYGAGARIGRGTAPVHAARPARKLNGRARRGAGLLE